MTWCSQIACAPSPLSVATVANACWRPHSCLLVVVGSPWGPFLSLSMSDLLTVLGVVHFAPRVPLDGHADVMPPAASTAWLCGSRCLCHSGCPSNRRQRSSPGPCPSQMIAHTAQTLRDHVAAARLAQVLATLDAVLPAPMESNRAGLAQSLTPFLHRLVSSL